ncbi:hypothetical protein DFR50_12511 [Roseiarcus fermentans]|uniref:Uncharacterized protein n=1 Tax=Roseiarcus fermentans TaxID=1473586 RepID=A0A366F3H0_9HYPH|nr:hypothetical protein [Roseiarcus fermentans]RBP08530.1 hypothetical protein DFR50_12511 [Roseiarcus fermentans]
MSGGGNSGLRVGELGLLVGVSACGGLHRLAGRRFAARDRRWRLLGEFPTERAAIAAIVKANEAAEQLEATRAAAPRQPPKARAGRLKRRPGPVRLRIGDSVRPAGCDYAGEVVHADRRRYLAADLTGRSVGAFTTLRRALEALRNASSPGAVTSTASDAPSPRSST